MSAELMDWTDVLSLNELEDGVITPVSIGDKALVLYRAGDEVRAFDGKCPHKARRWSWVSPANRARATCSLSVRGTRRVFLPKQAG
ncbi:Rieske (2Fe-2S) protein [Asaia platycodi]|uniref:Rieske (2Fe-2S) protein n=1 Tax=Asaia platycodi TaxID=610243 RepID=UPI0009DFE1C7